MGLKFSNNAFGTLAGGITNTATTIALGAGQGARFPILAAGDYFYATLMDSSAHLEVVKVTARLTDSLTVKRGQDGTAARAFLSGDRLELRVCNAALLALAQEAEMFTAATGAGVYSATLDPAPEGYKTEQVYRIFFPATNSIPSPTLSLNLLGPKTMKDAQGVDLVANQIPAGLYGFLVYDGTNFIVINITRTPLSYGGIADGLATLDGTVKVPMVQLHGAEANGVATLDAATRVPLAQLAAVFSIFVGCIMWRQSASAGMLQANGQVVSKTTYADLWAYAQGFLTADQAANPGLYRSVDSANFALPKLDGLFIRGQGQVDAQHVSGTLGVKQADDNKSHTHPTGYTGYGAGGTGGTSAVTGTQAQLSGTDASGGPEARPVNVAMVPCIFTGLFV